FQHIWEHQKRSHLTWLYSITLCQKKTGFEVAKEILKAKPEQKILFITSFGDEIESKLDELGNTKSVTVLEKAFNSSILTEWLDQIIKEDTTDKILQLNRI
ncbi:MAG: hypothetical protein QXY15_07810, partial [Candidatus Nitrosotenuis sp.]